MAQASLEPVRVSFVSSHALGGGSERYLELLLGSLDPAWVGGLISLQDGPFVERMRSLGHTVEVVPTSARAGIARSAPRLRRALRRQAPDVVHANGVKAALAAGLATPGTGIPVLWLKHDYSWDGPLARMVALRSRRVVAVSGAITTTFGKRLGSRVTVVPNGVPLHEREREVGREIVEQLVGAGSAPVVLLVGRLHPAKGQLELVEAVPRVLERCPDARFLVLGEEDPTQPEYAVKVRRRVHDLDVGSVVHFAGHRNDPMRVMSGTDLMLMPSVPDERGAGKEACPFALLEAMSVGTPVVAYAAGGIPEVLGDCGRLVAEGDRAALADAIADLLEDSGERSRASACALERVRARHHLSGMVEAMERLYRETARVPPRSAGR